MLPARVLFFLLLLSSSFNSFSQIAGEEKLKVFVDCKNVKCDNNFIRTEIKLVDFVLDRVAADVHILITSVKSGNGGNTVQYIFFGQNDLSRFSDTLSGNLNPNLTSAESRVAILQKIKQGLFPFISHSFYGDLVEIGMKPANWKDNPGTTEQTTDKWNYWVVNVGSDGSYNAEQVYKTLKLNGHVNVNRTTDKLKVGFSSYVGYNNSSYTFEDTGGTKKNVVINSNYSLNHNLVKSISSHWSIGYDAHLSNNTFENNKLRRNIRAALEYAIFPYSEVNNKFLTLNYGVNVRHNRYYDTTIYNRISEVLWGHRAQAYLSLKQKWGNANCTISYSSFFHDLSLNNLSLNLNVNVRITGGLSFNVYSYGGLVHDQVYLARGKASEEDILVKRRQIASTYYINSGVGLNFRFGSILNNFVNPRFDHP
jgi:hypothetical protein